ncbi:MAG: hypothetical protein KGJ55_00980 [Gammaproteobacteria bacterium]|nr:hypothetical protein [Gammaproteobacteria bacterium]
MTKDEIEAIFRSEFSPLLGKFRVHDLTLDNAPNEHGQEFNRPGVCVFWKQDAGVTGVIKVGRSLCNAKARALQHITDNTRNEHLQMATLKNDAECHLLLFTVPCDHDIHWVLSLEHFLERKLDLVIPANRNG